LPANALLDPVVVAQLGNLELRARRILEGLYSGRHLNIVRGHSQDFSEHRPYNPGDEPKSLDWKIFGRTDRLVVRQYEEQTNIAATVLLDDSASMNFSAGGRLSKLEYARTMAAALGYLVTRQGDAVGLVTRQGSLLPASARGHLERYFGQLTGTGGGGTWHLSDVASSAGALRKRGFVVVISDLWDDAEKILSAVRFLAARKNEVIVFQVIDPVERDLALNGPIRFTDMETGEEIVTDADAIRDDYRAVYEERRERLAHAFHGSGVDYLVLTTDTPFDKGLGAFLSWRMARS
jgi:uncharacterized protein (DUF58 family)